jgi:hypothetical protein
MQKPTGWVTFTTFRLYGRVFLVQKKDGSTRTIPTTTPKKDRPHDPRCHRDDSAQWRPGQ